MPWGKIGELVVTAGATLGAAYWGARAAFDFNRKQEADRTRSQQVEECNRAMLVLFRQYNWLLNYRRQFLDPCRDSEARHLFLPPSDPLDYKPWTVDVPALAFLLQTPATEMPVMLGMADEQFHGVIALINARSAEHREFQLALASSPLDKSSPQPLEALHNAIGERLAVTLQRATDQLFELVEAAILSLQANGKSARNVLKTLYPGSVILGFAPPPEHGDSGVTGHPAQASQAGEVPR